MKRSIKIFAALAVALIAGGCSKENPFPGGEDAKTGMLSKEALSVSLGNEEGMEKIFNRPAATRAEAPAPEDFTVKFYKEDTAEEVASYLYSEMPEVVTLPVGAIRAEAVYGENAAQDWETPYFKGETKFVISAGRVTDDVEPIVATLSNVRVTVVFAPALLEAMSADSKVTVVVGEQGTLDFDRNTGEKSGYFAYVENSRTLTATFNGKVDGFNTVETKGYDNVAPGNHYRITFRLHDANEDGVGDINGGLTVDASVEVVDMNVSVDPDDEVLDDDMRPVQGEEEAPNPPTPPTPGEKEAPTVDVLEPTGEFAGYNKVDLSKRNSCDNLYCAFKIISTAEGGVTAFTVDINSTTLTASELENVGLAPHLDLVNPGDLGGSLSELGFPVNVGGEKELLFDITSFMPMLSALGAGTHDFVLKITDANGTRTVTIQLESK